jgi:hypothetical protein
MKKSMVVEHVNGEVKGSFDHFTFHLEKALGILSPSALKAMGAVPESMTRFLNSTNDENDLVLFNIYSSKDLPGKRKSKKIKQYQIGNRTIMLRMLAKQAAAGLYFPIQLLVYEKPDGKVAVEYDLPSSLFGRFNNPEIDADAMILENNLIKVIRAADNENRKSRKNSLNSFIT